MGNNRKDLTKQQVLKAMKYTNSVKAAGRYLGVSYPHIKSWMKLYRDETTGLSLFELHKNPGNEGVSKRYSTKLNSENAPLIDLMEGRLNIANFNPAHIKDRMIYEGILKDSCYHCGFKERRVLDDKTPLILKFNDKNKNNYNPKNLELLCYNCYFLYGFEVFDDVDLKYLETIKPSKPPTDKVNMEVDEYHLERLRELGLGDDNEDDKMDGSEYISRK